MKMFKEGRDHQMVEKMLKGLSGTWEVNVIASPAAGDVHHVHRRQQRECSHVWIL